MLNRECVYNGVRHMATAIFEKYVYEPVNSTTTGSIGSDTVDTNTAGLKKVNDGRTVFIIPMVGGTGIWVDYQDITFNAINEEGRRTY